ncbi:hypothetical protein I6R01_004498 [Salmonella enterica subsp. enterica serovar Cerro]|nr:hypothetical protein [Salmonella enterica subsp. enterica serovar Cerro]
MSNKIVFVNGKSKCGCVMAFSDGGGEYSDVHTIIPCAEHSMPESALTQRIAELEARAFNPAILDVIAERQRQQSVEGWTPEHDDEHCNGELAMAAVCYINDTGTVNRNGGKPWGWPWDASWWKPDTRRRNLVKAGALILAEIERIDRAAGIKVKGDDCE